MKTKATLIFTLLVVGILAQFALAAPRSTVLVSASDQGRVASVNNVDRVCAEKLEQTGLVVAHNEAVESLLQGLGLGFQHQNVSENWMVDSTTVTNAEQLKKIQQAAGTDTLVAINHHLRNTRHLGGQRGRDLVTITVINAAGDVATFEREVRAGAKLFNYSKTGAENRAVQKAADEIVSLIGEVLFKL